MKLRLTAGSFWTVPSAKKPGAISSSSDGSLSTGEFAGSRGA
ncbi:hypothetical protein [Aquimonas voraii]|nr:hypothetical protein [Aquimonas voraii]